MTAHKTNKKRKKKETKKLLWKRQDEKKREKKRTTRSKLIMFGATFLIIGLIALFIIRMFSSGTWKGRQRYNLLVGKPDEMHALVSVSADEADVLVVLFHPDFIVESVYGYGDYKIGSLLKLGKIEDLGDELVKRSVQNTLGLKVHGYINHSVSSSLDLHPNSWLLGLVRPMALSLIGNEIGILDIFKFSDNIRTLREDQIEVLPLHESRYAITVIQSDGTKLYQLDKLRMDGYLLDRIKSQVYSEEGLGVSVINTTQHYGLASSVSRILLSSGLDVVGVGENQTDLIETQVLVKDEDVKRSETAQFVTGVIDSHKLSISDTEEYRADIVILIGEDYQKFMSQKPE